MTRRNVTFRMDEAALERARELAARQGKSFSRFVSELLAQQLGSPKEQQPPSSTAACEGAARRDRTHDDRN